jgi:hypothetical protein
MPAGQRLCRVKAAAGALAALLAGCGTEPSLDIAGTWSVTASYSGGGSTCTVVATLTVFGTGPSWSGRLAETQAGCASNGVPVTFPPDTANVIGTADGRSLSFTPQPPEGESPCALLNFEGEVGGDQMSGTVRTTPVFCQGTYVQMNGTWDAQRS